MRNPKQICFELPPFCVSAKRRGHPFFRSYGARLPSSLTRFHSRALVYSTHPPVSVYGTGNHGNIMELFLVSNLRNPHRPKSPRQLAPLPLSIGSSSL